MLAHRYKEENGLAPKRSACVAPEENIRECVTCTPPPITDLAAHSGFKTRRRHQKSETGGIGSPMGETCVPQFFFKKCNFLESSQFKFYRY